MPSHSLFPSPNSPLHFLQLRPIHPQQLDVAREIVRPVPRNPATALGAQGASQPGQDQPPAFRALIVEFAGP